MSRFKLALLVALACVCSAVETTEGNQEVPSDVNPEELYAKPLKSTSDLREVVDSELKALNRRLTGWTTMLHNVLVNNQNQDQANMEISSEDIQKQKELATLKEGIVVYAALFERNLITIRYRTLEAVYDALEKFREDDQIKALNLDEVQLEKLTRIFVVRTEWRAIIVAVASSVPEAASMVFCIHKYANESSESDFDATASKILQRISELRELVDRMKEIIEKISDEELNLHVDLLDKMVDIRLGCPECSPKESEEFDTKPYFYSMFKGSPNFEELSQGLGNEELFKTFEEKKEGFKENMLVEDLYDVDDYIASALKLLERQNSRPRLARGRRD